MRKIILYSLILFGQVFCVNNILGQYTSKSIPNPKNYGQEYFVSNPDGILDPGTEARLNRLSQHIDSLTGAEYAVVVVEDYVGDSDFEFALNLFNSWDIGKKQANNGLLLFVAKKRREYRFISGYGMEGIFPDAYLKRVGEKYLVPNFRNADYGQGVLEASEFIQQILESQNSMKELQSMMPEAMPFWSFTNPIFNRLLWILGFFVLLYLYVHFVAVNILPSKKNKVKLIAPIFWGMGCMLLLLFFTIFIFAFWLNNVKEVYQLKNLPYFAIVFCLLALAMKITNGRSAIIESFGDEEDKQDGLKKYVNYLFIPMLLTPLAWFDLLSIFRRFSKNKGRFTPPDSSGDWIRINRSCRGVRWKEYLNGGHLKEEKIKSLQYEIWKNSRTGEINLLPWNKDSRFGYCPKCHFYTMETGKTKTIKSATYSSSGQGERFDFCENCNYKISQGFYTIPVKVESSSGGSSSSGGRGGSSSSSGGGSFGGGASGGGGAGGRW